MGDPFRDYLAELDSPARLAGDITPSDTVDLTTIARAIYIGVAGNIRATLVGMADGTYVTFANVAAGAERPWRVKRLWSTGTTATNLIWLA